MKITVDRNLILNAFNIADAIIPSRQLNDIFSYALLKIENKNLYVYATDLEVYIKVFIAGIDAADDGITLPSKKMISVIREFSGDTIDIEWDDNFRATIISNEKKGIERKFVIAGTSPDEFPFIEMPQNIDWIDTEADMLKDALNKTYYASSQGKDTYKHIFNGVFFDGKKDELNIVASDGKRLSYVQRIIENQNGFNISAIVPSKAILELEKVLEGKKTCKMAFDDRHAYFEIDDILIVSRLIEGQFPDYEAVIPKELKYTVTLNREKVLSALRSASIFAREDKFEKTLFVFEKGQLNIKSESDLGEAEVSIDIEYADEPISIVFNNSFVIDVLKSVDFENFIIGINSDSEAALFLFDDDKDYKYVLMPVKI